MVYYAGPQGTQFVQDDPRFQLPSGTQQVTTNQNVPTGGFEALLNQLRTGVDANRGLLGKAARYGPGSVRTLEEFGKGNYLESAGSVGGMLAAGAGV
jgi:hypothetical protein